MTYILRAAVHEDQWERQLADILSLSQKAGIGEVMLMEQSHQIMMAPYPMEKHERMAEIYRRMAELLRQNGIVFSINMATVVGHSESPVPQDHRLPFGRFVGDDLKERSAVYCITDPAWQDYTARVCALYARSRPKKLMIDDDFRSLNHTARFGCFCENHARLVSERLGEPLTSRQLLDFVCGNDEKSLLVRKLWTEVNFEAQLSAARKIEQAVHAVDPEVQVGLMNSGECSHSLQGRDMPRLLRAFAGEKHRPLTRPAGGSYSDGLHETVIEYHQLPALSYHAAGGEAVHCVSEIENWPCTLRTKSMRETLLQMQLHALLGSDDLTLNLFDYLATPYDNEPAVIRTIRESRPSVEAIAAARKGKELTGIGLPWKKDAALCQVNRTGGVGGVLPRRPLDLLLPILGVPTQFAPAAVNAIEGDDILCYSDEELKTLLSGGLLLGPYAAGHLCQRGYADLIGCRVGGRLTEPVFEKLHDARFAGGFENLLLPTNWFRLWSEGTPLLQLEPLPGAFSGSLLVGEDKTPVCPGTVLYENELGGKVCTLAVPVHRLNWLFRARGGQLSAVFRWMGAEGLPILEDSPDVAPFCYVDGETGEGLLALVNCGLDDQPVSLRFAPELRDLFTGKPAGDILLPPVSARFYLFQS